MKRKLIDLKQENLVQCDNPHCDFAVKNPTGQLGEDSSKFLNVACPKCGWNLLTAKDHALFESFRRKVNWINKWFSWLTYLDFTRWFKSDTTAVVHFHNEVRIETKKDSKGLSKAKK